MKQAAGGNGQPAHSGVALSASASYDGGDSSCIGDARQLAVGFLTELRDAHSVAVSARAVGMTQLVVSELVTNAVKYAPGPLRLDLQISKDTVRVSVWDSQPVLPAPAGGDPQRVGRHGLEITLAISQAYEVRAEPAGKTVTAVIALTDEPSQNI
ncbi:ATP-binding protein [Streptomyces sp. NPDC095817]|uniref:ATP-binding protein n=1 Tax=Streptomyces sp. NPDC095817 TaxID=3155082 RepID=UPI0033213797